MTSITYKELYSRFYLKVEAYDLLELTKDMRDEFLCGYVHSTLSKPYIRRLFSSITITDPSVDTIENPEYDPNDPNSLPFISQETDGMIEFELKHKNDKADEKEDADFVIEAIALGIVLEWTEPKVNSLTNMRKMIGTSDEKWYSESTFITSLINLRESAENSQRNLIRDRGFIYNDYLEGKSASAKIRKK